MKSRTVLLASLLSVPLTFLAGPSFAAYAEANDFGSLAAAQAAPYFEADTMVTVLALVLAGSAMLTAKYTKTRRNLQAVRVQPQLSADDKWRGAVYHSLEVDLQEFTSRLRHSAVSRA